jgi:hypothetical protein
MHAPLAAIAPAPTNRPAPQAYWRAELLVAAAEDELLRLREQLDVANAAAAELYVEHRLAEFSTFVRRENLALDRVHVLNGREVEVLAPNETARATPRTRRPHAIARRRARFDEGGALPVLAEVW